MSYSPDDQAADFLRGRPVPFSDREVARRYVAKFDEAWHERGKVAARSDDWPTSIRRFHERGLDLDALLSFVDEAMEREDIAPDEKWRFVCNKCWRRLEREGKR